MSIRRWLERAALALAFLAVTAAGPPPATNPDAARFLRELPWPHLEPQIRWGWDPTAFEPLANPTPEEFRWRIKELRRGDRPAVVYARLNLELAFLGASAPAADRNDSLGVERRARLSRQLYGKLLAETPGQAEFLTDLGDLHRFLGSPDSALADYRQALAATRPPARLFVRLADAELEAMTGAGAPDSAAARRLFDTLDRGSRFFAATPPVDSLRAARFLLEKGRFRIDRTILETRASALLHPDQWRNAGVDSSFALLARIVSPETRRTIQAAAERDTNLAEAYGLLGSVVTGQILLPVAGRSLLLRQEAAPDDSLTARLWRLLVERRGQRDLDGKYAAANLNRCEDLEPARYPRVRAELARLALLMADPDGAAGLWRALLTRESARSGEHAAELYTVYCLEPWIESGRSPAPAGRMASALGGGAAAGDPEILALLGLFQAEQGKFEEARVAWTRAVTADSTEWRARLGLAALALRGLDAATAEPHLRLVGREFAAVDDVGRGLYCGVVGLLYWARNDAVSARRWLTDAARFDPRNQTVRDALMSLIGGGPMTREK